MKEMEEVGFFFFFFQKAETVGKRGKNSKKGRERFCAEKREKEREEVEEREIPPPKCGVIFSHLKIHEDFCDDSTFVRCLLRAQISPFAISPSPFTRTQLLCLELGILLLSTIFYSYFSQVLIFKVYECRLQALSPNFQSISRLSMNQTDLKLNKTPIESNR